MEYDPQRTNLPERIGMSLSGGGFRAAAFHLGSLDYLQRAGLMDNVRMLSTVSGGTFTGARYALSRLEGRLFNEFLRRYYDDLGRQRDADQDPFFEVGLNLLATGKPTDTPSGRRNLITSMAEAYSNGLFSHPDEKRPYLLGDLLDGDTGPLTDITFNATDFRTGIAFRFQKSKSERGLIGNYYTSLPPEAAGQMRLGDVVAASSCFPGGFEPMEFPEDFGWPGDKMPAEIQEQFREKSIALMDGGVYDNQGIDSLMLADRRTDPAQEEVKEEARGLDLFVMSDTDRTSNNLYDMPASVRDSKNFVIRTLAWWNPSLASIDIMGYGLQVLCLITIGAVVVSMITRGFPQNATDWVWMLAGHFVPMLMSLTTVLAVAVVRQAVQAGLQATPVVKEAAWKEIRRIGLGHLMDMLNLRITSLLAMTMDIFMKRIRQLGYRYIYEDPRYKDKLLANYVYQLAGYRKWFFAEGDWFDSFPEPLQQYVKQHVPPPTPELKAVAVYADRMPTTLWFTNACQLPALLAAGQAAMCFNLMKFVARSYRFDAQTQQFAGAGQELWTKLLADWQRLREDPYALAKESLGRTDLLKIDDC